MPTEYVSLIIVCFVLSLYLAPVAYGVHRFFKKTPLLDIKIGFTALFLICFFAFIFIIIIAVAFKFLGWFF